MKATELSVLPYDLDEYFTSLMLSRSCTTHLKTQYSSYKAIRPGSSLCRLTSAYRIKEGIGRVRDIAFCSEKQNILERFSRISYNS